MSSAKKFGTKTTVSYEASSAVGGRRRRRACRRGGGRTSAWGQRWRNERPTTPEGVSTLNSSRHSDNGPSGLVLGREQQLVRGPGPDRMRATARRDAPRTAVAFERPT